MYRIIYFFLLLATAKVCAQQATVDEQHSATSSSFILNAFDKADLFMDDGHYDSAQVWLNKIYLKVSYRKPSTFSYYLTTRQAEVYYYNNLQQLGMQEALKGENIAKVLKDSLLIGDACNFIGLFHLNSNRYLEAKNYFKKGLVYILNTHQKKHYIPLSEAHHIYGNLAETFEKLKVPDSAIYYCRISLQYAIKAASKRGIATAYINLGAGFLLANQIDSAYTYFEKGRQTAIKSNDFDVELTCYSGLADCASANGAKAEAFKSLETGFALIKEYPQVNNFYVSMFLSSASKIYKKYKEENLLIKTILLKLDLQTETYKNSNIQIESLLSMGLQNEKTIFGLELAESENKQALANTRNYILLLLLLVMVVAFIAYRYYALQRLRLANLRTKISQDLHDEVGATLSGIAMYSYITKSQIESKDNVAVNNSLDIIKDNAGEMVAKLNDIVWAVNPVGDNLYALLERLRDFALQLTAAKNIKLEFLLPENLKQYKLKMEKRKNIYLICKEAINNAVKYSEANNIKINAQLINNQIYIVVQDDGKGFSSSAKSSGNGLMNMENRAKEIDGVLKIDGASGIGTSVNFNCKIT